MYDSIEAGTHPTHQAGTSFANYSTKVLVSQCELPQNYLKRYKSEAAPTPNGNYIRFEEPCMPFYGSKPTDCTSNDVRYALNGLTFAASEHRTNLCPI